jgi:hypothetical protein
MHKSEIFKLKIKSDIYSWNCLNFGIGSGSDCVRGRPWKPEIETGCRVECFHIYGKVPRHEEEVKQAPCASVKSFTCKRPHCSI